ncbi:uncharacterized protein LOC129309700 isoform X2 [Prosopis cineraria]|uniref:uncharacterized protein LOC129309700 isoform X2 n=1 Tax=Prosopis cineraria TaxID=364024 RepID=UPI0024103633|nr:uncharacterized protein LOC129309700 isoform X2 [Prosopis cineraria]
MYGLHHFYREQEERLLPLVEEEFIEKAISPDLSSVRDNREEENCDFAVSHAVKQLEQCKDTPIEMRIEVSRQMTSDFGKARTLLQFLGKMVQDKPVDHQDESLLEKREKISVLSRKRIRAILQRGSSWSTILTFLLHLTLSNYTLNEQGSLSIWIPLLKIFNFVIFMSSIFIMGRSSERFTRIQIFFLVISATVINIYISASPIPFYVFVVAMLLTAAFSRA